MALIKPEEKQDNPYSRASDFFANRSAFVAGGPPDAYSAQREIAMDIFQGFQEDKRSGRLDAPMLLEYYGLKPDCTPEDLYKKTAELYRIYNADLWVRPTVESLMVEDQLAVPIATPVESCHVGRPEHSVLVGPGMSPLIIVAEQVQHNNILETIGAGIRKNVGYRSDDWAVPWVAGRVLRMPTYESQKPTIQDNMTDIPCNGQSGNLVLKSLAMEILDRRQGEYTTSMAVDEVLILQNLDALLASGKIDVATLRTVMRQSGPTEDVGSISAILLMEPSEYVGMLNLRPERDLITRQRVLLGKMDTRIAKKIGANLWQANLAKEMGKMDSTQAMYINGAVMTRNWLVQS